MQKNIKNIIVVFGLGAIGGVHLECLLRRLEKGLLGNFRIGIFSSKPAVRRGDLRGAPQKNNLGVKVRDTISPELLEQIIFFDSDAQILTSEEVLAVILCTPTSTHVSLAAQLNAAGIHVLVEKPFGFDHHKINQMLLCSNVDCRILVGHILPYFPPYAWLLGNQPLLEGKLVAELSRIVCNSNPINQPKNSRLFGDAVTDLIVHDIQLALLVKRKSFPVAVEALEWRYQPRLNKKFLSWGSFQITFNDGSVFTITAGASKNEKPNFSHSFCFVTANAVLQMREDGVTTLLRKPETRPLKINLVNSGMLGVDIIPFEREHDDLFTAINDQNFVANPLENKYALIAVKLAEACRESARTERTVIINGF